MHRHDYIQRNVTAMTVSRLLEENQRLRGDVREARRQRDEIYNNTRVIQAELTAAREAAESWHRAAVAIGQRRDELMDKVACLKHELGTAHEAVAARVDATDDMAGFPTATEQRSPLDCYVLHVELPRPLREFTMPSIFDIITGTAHTMSYRHPVDEAGHNLPADCGQEAA